MNTSSTSRGHAHQGLRLIDLNTYQLNHAGMPQISGRRHAHWIAAAGLFVSTPGL